MSLEDLRRSFLVADPRYVEQTPLFYTNLNTKQLVQVTFQKTEEYEGIKAGIAALSEPFKKLTTKWAIGSFIRQAQMHVKAGDFPEAEPILTEALKVHPDDPELFGALAWVYKVWPGRRLEDARQAFLKAHECGATRLDTYLHWAEMENNQEEWALVAEAAERGLGCLKDQQELLYWAGYGRSRLGRALKVQLQPRAIPELLNGERLLKRALRSQRVSSDRPVRRTRIFRALVLTYEALERWDPLAKFLKLWGREAPGDELEHERERLWLRYPEVRERLQEDPESA